MFESFPLSCRFFIEKVYQGIQNGITFIQPVTQVSVSRLLLKRGALLLIDRSAVSFSISILEEVCVFGPSYRVCSALRKTCTLLWRAYTSCWYMSMWFTLLHQRLTRKATQDNAVIWTVTDLIQIKLERPSKRSHGRQKTNAKCQTDNCNWPQRESV